MLDLVAAIETIVINIKRDVLGEVFMNFREEIKFCANSNIARFENIYRKLRSPLEILA